MAKAGFWLRGARGKLAGASLQKGANGTIMREIVDPANPKTRAQALQRLAFSTAVRTAKALELIVDHSFEGIKYGADSVRHFVKLNAPVFKAAVMAPYKTAEGFEVVPALPMGQLIIEKAGAVKGVPCGFLLSAGSLPNVGGTLVRTHSEDPNWNSGYGLVLDMFKTNAPATFKVSDAIALGLDTSLQYTIVGFGGGTNSVKTAKGAIFNSGWTPTYVRINFVQNLDTTKVMYVSDGQGGYNLNPDILDAPRCTNISDITYNSTIQAFVIGDGCHGYGCITSLFENNAWRRSTTPLLIPSEQDFAEETVDPNTIGAMGWNILEDLIQDYINNGGGSEDRFLNKETQAVAESAGGGGGGGDEP